MTARDMTRLYAFVSARKWCKFLHIWGKFLTKLHRKPGEIGRNPLEKIKNPASGENSLKLQISVPHRGRSCPDISCAVLFAFTPSLLLMCVAPSLHKQITITQAALARRSQVLPRASSTLKQCWHEVATSRACACMCILLTQADAVTHLLAKRDKGCQTKVPGQQEAPKYVGTARSLLLKGSRGLQMLTCRYFKGGNWEQFRQPAPPSSKQCPKQMPYHEGPYGTKILCTSAKQMDFHKLLWPTNPDFYGMRFPTFMSHEPIYWGWGLSPLCMSTTMSGNRTRSSKRTMVLWDEKI